MEFKIDTKATYTNIKPASSVFNANLTDALWLKLKETGQSGSPNFIVDLDDCSHMDTASAGELVKMHKECYSNNQSLVFTNIKADFMKQLKQHDIDVLNIAPTLQEAIDIINMEILERDLFNEEA